MELIRRNTDYALRALILMAKEKQDRMYQITRLADAARVPEGFLRKTFQRLDKAGIIGSRRGPKGGFSLAKRPGDITVLEVLEAVQGPLAVNKCFLEGLGCANYDRCRLKDGLVGAQESMIALFNSVTIEQLATGISGSEVA